jgi:hypothetical protein
MPGRAQLDSVAVVGERRCSSEATFQGL